MMKTIHISLLAVVLVLSGCSVPGENLSRKGLVTVERVSSQKADIAWASVYRIDRSLIIRGAVRRRGNLLSPLLVHVDATVLSADGQVLKEAIGRDIWVRRRPAGKSPTYVDHASFEIRLPMAPPEGSTVRLVCHDGSRDIHSAPLTAKPAERK